MIYIIMVIEKSNAWLLHVTMVLNFFRSRVSPQKASRSLMVLSRHPAVLWEYFFTIPRTAGALVPTFQIPRPDGSLVLKFSNACWDNSSFILIFFFKYVEPTKIEGPPHNRYLSMLGGYQKMAENRAKFQAGFKSNTSEHSPESYPVGNLFVVCENRSLEIMSLLIYNWYPIKVLKNQDQDVLNSTEYFSTFSNPFRC
jgi:hypothetical protein